jgi:PIN domain nuclease of toxin-antitoxin system
MTPEIRLDTHVVVWLHAGLDDKLSPLARAAIEQNQLAVAPMVEFELTLLHEIGRLSLSGAEILGDLSHRVGLRVSAVPWQAAVQSAAGLTWTRDPFDRLIVADALAAGSLLLTKDERVRERVPSAVW